MSRLHDGGHDPAPATGFDAATATALVELALRWLRRMYLPGERLFCFKAVLGGDGPGAPGRARPAAPDAVAPRIVDVSPLYTAIVLVGLRSAEAGGIDHGFDRRAIGAALAERLDDATDPGTAALAVWGLADLPAAAAAVRRQLDRLGARVRSTPECGGDDPCRLTTMQACWLGSALLSLVGAGRRIGEGTAAAAARGPSTPARARELLADVVRLVRSCCAPRGDDPRGDALRGDGPAAGPLFAYAPPSHRRRGAWARLRAPYCYFAEQVYGILFLSGYAAMTGDAGALEVARRAARAVIDAQSPEGGWGWLYDSRDGRIVDPFPLYSVHQDAMAPMALLALADADSGGADDWIAAVGRSYGFLSRSVGGMPPIWDRHADVIFRSVRRRVAPNLFHNVAKVLHRVGLEAAMPRATRLPGLGFDRELRPYHMGWILHALAPQLGTRLAGPADGEPRP